MAAKAKIEQAMSEAAPEKVSPPKVELARLRKDCLQLFGVTVSTFNGATFGLTGRFTVEEMRNRIKKWQDLRIISAKKKEVN